MKRDDIIRMARETGLLTEHNYREIINFGSMVAAAEREACADMVLTLTCMGNAKECFEVAATYIRARGQV
ncbi:hypothetical protein UFOVP137_39 [uncultured Caudovirales phage]|uniref:Uncharacterized protein n=1 Tax=uncultured Caudovirales phage TaxID=2100421 RepID=A0A6J5LEA7_9CAUD|nr:hypothetical protein UFOVP137_39 [uncultured Caudovirales phage]